MTSSAIALQRRLPVGVHRVTGRMMTLAEAAADDAQFLGPRALDRAQLTDLLIARWTGGEWEDLTYRTELVDLDRALHELRSGSPLGLLLLDVGARAVEMALEDERRGLWS